MSKSNKTSTWSRLFNWVIPDKGNNLLLSSVKLSEKDLMTVSDGCGFAAGLVPEQMGAAGIKEIESYAGEISMVQHQSKWLKFYGTKYDRIVIAGLKNPLKDADIICIGAYLESDSLFYLDSSGNLSDITFLRSKLKLDFRKKDITCEPLDSRSEEEVFREMNRHYIDLVVSNNYLVPKGENKQDRALDHFQTSVGLAQDLVLNAPEISGDPWYGVLLTESGSLVRNADPYLAFVNLLLLIPDMENVLEVGCGSGFIPLYLNAKGDYKKVVGVDAAENRIAGARLLNKLSGLDCEFKVMNGEKLDFADKSFDLVTTSFALEQCKENLPQVLEELLRITRKYLILREPSLEVLPTLPGLVHIYQHGYPEGYIERITEMKRPYSIRLPLLRHYHNPVVIYAVNMHSEDQPHLIVPQFFDKDVLRITKLPYKG